MLELTPTITLIAATVTSGLNAGLFYAFSCLVMPGLARTDDHTFVTAMRSINATTFSGWFALSFVGAPLLTTVAAALHLVGDRRTLLPLILAAFVFHLGTLAVTGRGNVPRNNHLAATEDEPELASAEHVRADFEVRWNRWNHVRTLTSLAAFSGLGLALTVH